MAESEKDKQVQQLFDLLQKKKEEIAKTEKPNWITNCSFSQTRSGSDRTNIQTVSDIDELNHLLAALLQRAKAYDEAKKLLETEGTFKWGGFTAEEWTADFKTRANKITISKKKKNLKN